MPPARYGRHDRRQAARRKTTSTRRLPPPKSLLDAGTIFALQHFSHDAHTIERRLISKSQHVISTHPSRLVQRPFIPASTIMFERLREDIATIRERDPAARSAWEVLTCYPGLHALVLHRLSHR